MSARYPYRGVWPRIDPRCFVAPTCSVIGDVVVGEGSSLWFGATLRGDVEPIRVGARTSIQDNTVVHATGGWWPTTVGDECTVGHSVILHGCTVGDRVLVGMGAIVMDDAQIGSDVIIGAGALVTPRTIIEPGVLVLGRPAKPARALRDEELAQIRESASAYAAKAAEYIAAMAELGPGEAT